MAVILLRTARLVGLHQHDRVVVWIIANGKRAQYDHRTGEGWFKQMSPEGFLSAWERVS